MFDGTGEFLVNVLNEGHMRNVLSQLGMERKELYILLAATAVCFLVELLQYFRSPLVQIDRFPLVLRWGVYYAILGCILFLGSFNVSQQFIYMQF